MRPYHGWLARLQECAETGMCALVWVGGARWVGSVLLDGAVAGGVCMAGDGGTMLHVFV